MLDIYMDLDDTLIQTQQLFEKYKRACASFILIASKRDDLTNGEVLSYFNGREQSNIDSLGFQNERFIISWKETYQHFIPFGDDVQSIGRLANMVFESVAPLKDGAIETLEALKEKGYSIRLITVGVESTQMKRIQDVALSHYFERIHIVPYKDKQTMDNLIKDKTNSVMVGNSVRSDINPSIEIGIPAIQVEAPNWFHDEVPLIKGGMVYYGTLDRVPELIEEVELWTTQNKRRDNIQLFRKV